MPRVKKQHTEFESITLSKAELAMLKKAGRIGITEPPTALIKFRLVTEKDTRPDKLGGYIAENYVISANGKAYLKRAKQKRTEKVKKMVKKTLKVILSFSALVLAFSELYIFFSVFFSGLTGKTQYNSIEQLLQTAIKSMTTLTIPQSPSSP